MAGTLHLTYPRHLMCASKKGISTHQIQRMLRCSMKTAWFLGHRIRESRREIRDMFTPRMGGAGRTIEADPLAEASATARRRQRTMRSPKDRRRRHRLPAHCRGGG